MTRGQASTKLPGVFVIVPNMPRAFVLITCTVLMGVVAGDQSLHAETDTPAPVYDQPAPVSVYDTETGYTWVQIDEQTIEISQAD